MADGLPAIEHEDDDEHPVLAEHQHGAVQPWEVYKSLSRGGSSFNQLSSPQRIPVCHQISLSATRASFEPSLFETSLIQSI